MSDVKANPPELTRFQKLGTLLILSLALAIIIIDSSILNVSITNLIKDLNTDIQTMQWIISIYSLVMAALTITGGRLGDLFGRKRMFLLGAVIFAIGSFIASISPNATVLLIGWSIIEGIGAALMMPATASLLVSTFKGRERAMAFGIWGGVAGAAAAFGPIVGGYVTTYLSWHWAFRINVGIVILLLIASFIVKESRDTKEKPKLDFVGVILSALSLFLIVFGIIQSSTYGWLSATRPFDFFGSTIDFAGISVVPISIVLGLILLGVFAWWQIHQEKNNQTPLVSMKLFQNRQFSAGLITMTVIALGQSGTFFAIPIFLQAVRGLDAFHTGISFLPMSITLLVAAPVAGYLTKYVSPKRIVLAGLIVNFLAVVTLYFSFTVDATATTLIPGMFLLGLGMGLVMSQINNIILSSVHVYQAGEASGVNSTIRQVGATLGSAIIGAIFLSAFTTTFVNGINGSNVIPERVKAPMVQAVQNAGSNLEFGGADQLKGNSQLPQPIVDEITSFKNQSTVEGNRNAIVVTGIVTIIGFISALTIPDRKNVEHAAGETTVAAGH